MEIPVKVQIEGLPFVKEVITRIVNEASFSEDTTEDYIDGFYDFGNAIVSVLESIENGQEFE